MCKPCVLFQTPVVILLGLDAISFVAESERMAINSHNSPSVYNDLMLAPIALPKKTGVSALYLEPLKLFLHIHIHTQVLLRNTE